MPIFGIDRNLHEISILQERPQSGGGSDYKRKDLKLGNKIHRSGYKSSNHVERQGAS